MPGQVEVARSLEARPGRLGTVQIGYPIDPYLVADPADDIPAAGLVDQAERVDRTLHKGRFPPSLVTDAQALLLPDRIGHDGQQRGRVQVRVPGGGVDVQPEAYVVGPAALLVAQRRGQLGRETNWVAEFTRAG